MLGWKTLTSSYCCPTLHFSINGQLANEIFVIDVVVILVGHSRQHLIHLLLAKWLTCISYRHSTVKVTGNTNCTDIDTKVNGLFHGNKGIITQHLVQTQLTFSQMISSVFCQWIVKASPTFLSHVLCQLLWPQVAFLVFIQNLGTQHSALEWLVINSVAVRLLLKEWPWELKPLWVQNMHSYCSLKSTLSE